MYKIILDENKRKSAVIISIKEYEAIQKELKEYKKKQKYLKKNQILNLQKKR